MVQHKPLPLFWRLTLGYAAILLLSVGVSIYAVVQLGALSQTARAALDTDYRTIAQQEALTDALLSEARYGGQFLLNHAPSSYDQFRQFKSEFLRYLSELKAVENSSEIATQLLRVDHLHRNFHNLFEEEARYIHSGQTYAQSRYQQERNKILDDTLRELAQLKERLEKNVHDKLEQVSGTARSGRNIAIATTLILLIAGTALALQMSASITQPLLALTAGARVESLDEIGTVQISRIPEIQELSDVLNRQKQRLLRSAIDSSNQVERVTEQLASHLASFKKELNELNAKNEPAISRAGRSAIDMMLADTHSLIRYCAELNGSAAAQAEVMKLRPPTAQGQKTSPAPDNTREWTTRELADSQGAAPSAASDIAERSANLMATVVPLLRARMNDEQDKPK